MAQGVNKQTIQTGLGGGTVDSVNGQTGVVVLDTGDIAEVTDANYVSDAQLTVISNTSGTNSGDNAVNSLYSGLAGSKQNNIVLTTTGSSGPATLVGDTLNIPEYGGAGGSFTLTEVEVDLGSTPKRSGTFTITTSGLTSGKPVMINQASGPYTGKGTLADESEMDQLIVSAKTTSTTQIVCYWNSQYFVKKNFKFNYTVSA